MSARSRVSPPEQPASWTGEHAADTPLIHRGAGHAISPEIRSVLVIEEPCLASPGAVHAALDRADFCRTNACCLFVAQTGRSDQQHCLALFVRERCEGGAQLGE